MSGAEFHVHGPHDHSVEHAQSSHGSAHASQMAVATAVLATVGAIFADMGGATQADAALFKNDAAIKKTEASNQWNYYQAKSNKQNLAELSIDLLPASDKKEKYLASVERYKSEKEEIKKKAELLEAESTEFNEKSEQQMHQHHRWAQATTLLQVAIAMAAIALLTQNKWMERAMFIAAALGVTLGVVAQLHL